MKRRTVVKRSQWYRGQGGNLSALLRAEDGRMCCLGFDALAAGVADYHIRGRGEPREFQPGDDPSVFGWGEEWGCSSHPEDGSWLLCDEAIGYNDDPFCGDEEREADLIRVFAENGIELVFED